MQVFFSWKLVHFSFIDNGRGIQLAPRMNSKPARFLWLASIQLYTKQWISNAVKHSTGLILIYLIRCTQYITGLSVSTEKKKTSLHFSIQPLILDIKLFGNFICQLYLFTKKQEFHSIGISHPHILHLQKNKKSVICYDKESGCVLQYKKKFSCCCV